MYLTLLNVFIASWGIFFFFLILPTSHDRPLAKAMLLVFVMTQTMTPLGSAILSIGGGSVEVIGYLYNFFYLSGPVFYFYIRSLRQPSFRFDARCLWHFSPAIFIPLIFYTLVLPIETSFPTAKIHLLSMLIWFLGYLIAALRLLPGYKYCFDELFEPKQNTIWRWLYIPTLYYIVAYLLRVIYLITDLAFSLPKMEVDAGYIITMLARVVFIYLVALGGYRHRHIYELQEEDKLTIPDQVADGEGQAATAQSGGEKYQKSILSDEQVEVLWAQLKEHMSKIQPFLDETLKLSKLAEGIGVSGNELSRVINTKTGQGFHDFVNSYRAHKARTLIKQHANSTKPILELSLEAGFGNSATFYKYFKKHFDITPSKFRKSCQTPSFSSVYVGAEEYRGA